MKLSIADNEYPVEEKEKFTLDTVIDFALGELDVVMDKMEELEQTETLSSGDKQVMSLVQELTDSLRYVDTGKDVSDVLGYYVDILRQVNSRFASRLIRKLLQLDNELDKLWKSQDVRMYKQYIKAIKKIFAQENMEESHPELDKYQSIPISSPAGTDENLTVNDVEEERIMAPEGAPNSPEPTGMLQERIEKSLQLLDEIHDLFRASDIIVRDPKRKDRMLAQLVKFVLRGKKSAEALLKMLNRKPRPRK